MGLDGYWRCQHELQLCQVVSKKRGTTKLSTYKVHENDEYVPENLILWIVLMERHIEMYYVKFDVLMTYGTIYTYNIKVYDDQRRAHIYSTFLCTFCLW